MTKENNSFTVLIAVYIKDDATLFQKAIESILNNSLQPDQLLIVCDGPLSPQLDAVLDGFSYCSILKIVQLKKNSGLATALNAGLKKINTKFTIRADADDINIVTRFEKLIAKLLDGYDIVGSNIMEIDKTGNFLATKSVPESHQQIVKYCKSRNPFNHMSVGFKTSLVIDCGLYPDINLREDYALWAKLIRNGAKTCNLSEILVHATTGFEMYKRRGGIKNIKNEFNMQSYLVKLKFKSLPIACMHFLLRAIIFLLPNQVRLFVYINILRNKYK